jgi:phenylacetate-CoA ligase
VLEVRREGALDSLEVIVEIKPDRESELILIGDDCETLLKKNIRTVTGMMVGVKVVTVGTVERSMGKAKRVIDLRDLG